MLSDIEIERARIEQVLKDSSQGTTCRCCGQYVKCYRYKFHASLAYAMIRLTRLYSRTQDWIHVRELRNCDGGPNLGKAAFWNLIEPKPNKDITKRCSGLWRPTENGICFVHNQLLIPSHVFLYDGKARGFTDELVSVVDALGRRFNYTELMNGE